MAEVLFVEVIRVDDCWTPATEAEIAEFARKIQLQIAELEAAAAASSAACAAAAEKAQRRIEKIRAKQRIVSTPCQHN